MKYCPFCGSGLQDAMVFCPKCGKRFLDAFENPETIGQLDIESNLPECPEVSTQGSASTQVVDDASKADSIPPKEPARQPVKRKTKTGLVLLSAIFVFAVIAFVFFGKNDSKSRISITDAANSVLYLEVCDDEDNVIATASGFIIEEGTTLITNYHVIDGAHHIIAYTPDGEESVEIHIVLAYDEDADLAILECEENIGVQPLLLGDSDTVKQGDKVYAVGYPLGLANTLSDGVISSRYLDENNIDVLQITAAISSGSSGGALFNEVGQVIGVVCASYIDGQNLNIAIAANAIAQVVAMSNEEICLEELYEATIAMRDPTIGFSEEELEFWYALQGVWKYDAPDLDSIQYLKFDGRDFTWGSISNSRTDKYTTSESCYWGTFTIEGDTIVVELDSWESYRDGKPSDVPPVNKHFRWTPTKFNGKMLQFDWCYPPFYKA